MPGEGIFETPFHPCDNDVVSTRLKDWIVKHPGNKFYAELLRQYAEKANKVEEESSQSSKPENIVDLNAQLRQYADRIIEIITKDRKGRFLKLPDLVKVPENCHVMTKKQAMNKVVNALKNKQAALKKAKDNPQPQQPQQQQQQQQSTTSSPIKKEKIKKRKAEDLLDNNKPMGSKKRKLAKPKKPKIMYQAKPGDKMPINPYALELITHVCNHYRSSSSHSSMSMSSMLLETPISKYSTTAMGEAEPDKERRIRLQLRHRFFSAQAVEMPVIEFAKRLLEVWGGRLDEIKIQPPTTAQKKSATENGTSTSVKPPEQQQQQQQQPKIDGNSSQGVSMTDYTTFTTEAKPNIAAYPKVPNPLEPSGDKTEESTLTETRKPVNSSEKDATNERQQIQQSTASGDNATTSTKSAAANAVSTLEINNSKGNRTMKSDISSAKKPFETAKAAAAASKDGEDSGEEDYTSAKSDLEDHDEEGKQEDPEYKGSIDGMDDDDDDAKNESGDDDEEEANSEREESRNGDATDDDDEEVDDDATISEDEDEDEDDDDEDASIKSDDDSASVSTEV